MRRSPAVWTAMLAITLAPSWGCVIHGSWMDEPNVWLETSEELTIPLDAVDTFAVRAHNGRVDVDGEDRARTATVIIKKKAGGQDEEDAQACMDALEVKSERRGTTHALTSEWGTPRKSRWQASVSYQVHLPRAIALKAETHNGRLTVRGLREGCTVETHNGRIEVEDVAGDLEATTHNGQITVAAAAAPNIHLETHNGGIEAHLTDVRAINGHIQTHNGSVKVALASGASTRVDCSTHNGGIRSTLALNDVVMDRRSMKGTIGDGDGKLRVVTHNGSITLKE